MHHITREKLRGLAKSRKVLVGVAASTAVLMAGMGLATAATPSAVPAGEQTIFGDAVPRNVSASDDASVEVGVKFSSSANGVVSGIRFYKGFENTGTHTGTLWDAYGKKLASVTFANETQSGWQSAKFATPVSITKGKMYVASYLAPNGRYSADARALTKRTKSGSLSVPRRGGVFKYGSGGFPIASYRATNYFVDVTFTATPTSSGTTTTTVRPTTTSTTTGVPGTTIAPTTTVAPTTTSTVTPTTIAQTTTTVRPTTTVPKPTTTLTPTTVPPGSNNPPIAAPAGKQWNLSFSEEFGGSDYDHSKLTPCFDWNYGDCTNSFNTGREAYLPSQVRVSNGTAKLVAEPLNPPKASSGCLNGQCTYKSGLLSTARPNAANGSDYLYKFTYGYVESRMKVPATQGIFTAFWMLPADPSYVYRSEIDILELLGHDPTSMFMTYHYNDRDQSFTTNYDPNKNGACADKDYSKDFHNIGVDWQPNHIAWYIDGVKCQEFTNASQIENGPMQIIIDVMVDNKWQRDWNKTLLNLNTTAQLELDYLRVYQLK